MCYLIIFVTDLLQFLKAKIVANAKFNLVLATYSDQENLNIGIADKICFLYEDSYIFTVVKFYAQWHHKISGN